MSYGISDDVRRDGPRRHGDPDASPRDLGCRDLGGFAGLDVQICPSKSARFAWRIRS